MSEEAVLEQKAKPALPEDDLMIGDTVFWHNRGMLTQTPAPAIVLHKRGNGTLCLSVFTTTVGNRIYDGVRHYKSEGLNRAQLDQRGCWSLRNEELDHNVIR